MNHSEIMERKRAIRKEIRQKCGELSAAYQKEADAEIIKRLLASELYEKAETVFCFVGMEQEINTIPFLEQVLADGKTLAVPLCTGKRIMEARKIRSLSELKKGYYGILEPDKDKSERILPHEIGLAVIPCVTCSHEGVRLGHGGGYYDTYFEAAQEIPAVMICREALVRDDIPREAHDLIFPNVITEEFSALLQLQRNRRNARDIKESADA